MTGERDLEAALEIARVRCPEGFEIVRAGSVQLANGWFLPARRVPTSAMPEGGGIQGLIVNKVDGSTMEVGSGHLIDHALRSYEQGYTSAVVDLVVTEVRDEERTVEAIHAIGPTEVEVSFEADTVWRIRKRLTREEIGARLAALPCVFADLRVDGHMERLDGAANDRLFAFRTFPR